jgi:hypothetical protein
MKDESTWLHKISLNQNEEKYGNSWVIGLSLNYMLKGETDGNLYICIIIIETSMFLSVRTYSTDWMNILNLCKISYTLKSDAYQVLICFQRFFVVFLYLYQKIV